MEARDHLMAMPPYLWQKDTWSTLIQLSETNKLPHALIFTGPDGLGIEDFALAFGQYILCRDPSEGRACSRCKACLLMNTGNHPDLKLVVPEEKSEQLKVNQIRELNEFLAQTSQQGAWKVAILEPAHAMNQSAANALLKNLEEPAKQTLFILVSDEPQKILATIRSRCRQVALNAPDTKTATAWLQTNGVKNPEALLQLLGNAPLLALDWSHNNRLQEQEKIVAGIQGLLTKSTSTVAVAKQWAQYPPLDVMLALIRWLEGEIRRLSVNHEPIPGMNHLFRFGDRLRHKRTLLEGSANVNAALLVDEVAFDLMALSKIKGLFQPV